MKYFILLLLIADAYIDKLACAIGYKLLLHLETDLFSKTNLIKDEELEKYTNLYMDEINDIVLLFSNIGFNSSVLEGIIGHTAVSFKKIIIFPHLLIKHCEVSYNLKMAKALEIIEDEAGAYYFHQRTKRMQKFGSIEKLLGCNLNIPILGKTLKDMPNQYYTWCIKYIMEESPTLIEQILARLGITKNIGNNKEVPF